MEGMQTDNLVTIDKRCPPASTGGHMIEKISATCIFMWLGCPGHPTDTYLLNSHTILKSPPSQPHQVVMGEEMALLGEVSEKDSQSTVYCSQTLLAQLAPRKQLPSQWMSQCQGPGFRTQLCLNLLSKSLNVEACGSRSDRGVLKDDNLVKDTGKLNNSCPIKNIWRSVNV